MVYPPAGYMRPAEPGNRAGSIDVVEDLVEMAGNGEANLNAYQMALEQLDEAAAHPQSQERHRQYFVGPNASLP